MFKRIYEDMVNGKLSEARFQMLSEDYEQEQADLRIKIEMPEEEIQNQEDQTENVDKFIRQAKKYLHLEKLTPAVLNDLVKAVYVHAPDNSSGHRVQDVEISYNYIGILPATLLYDLQNGKTARPKSCRFPKTIVKLFYWTAPNDGVFLILLLRGAFSSCTALPRRCGSWPRSRHPLGSRSTGHPDCPRRWYRRSHTTDSPH